MKPRQFIDGDLIEKFLDLSEDQKREIFESVKDEELTSMEDLNKLVDSIGRLH